MRRGVRLLLVVGEGELPPRSLDHLVGEREQVRRDFEAERLRGLEIDDEFELVYLLDRQVGRVGALKNSTSVSTAFVIAITEDRSIAHQATGFDELAEFVERRDCMTCRKRDKVLAPTGEERVGADEKRIGPLLDKRREDLIEVVFSDRTHDTELERQRTRRALR